MQQERSFTLLDELACTAQSRIHSNRVPGSIKHRTLAATCQVDGTVAIDGKVCRGSDGAVAELYSIIGSDAGNAGTAQVNPG